MKPPVWRVEDDGEGLPTPGAAEPDLVSLRFLVAAARRRWRVVVAAGLVGAVLALGLLRMVGGSHTASTTVLLTSAPGEDPAAAMVTDLSLLGTRAVAQSAVTELGLQNSMSPEAFQATVTGAAPSSQLMTISVTGPSGAEAVRRANALAEVFLGFRADERSTLANTTIAADRAQVDIWNKQIDNLTSEFEAGVHQGQGVTADSLLTQRSQLQAQVNTTDLEIATTRLQNQAVINASHVVDPAAIVVTSHKKKLVLTIMSGLIGGTALGLAFVLAPAIVSSRLRRREDVARALGISVRFSAGRVRPRLLRPGGAALRQAERLAHGLATGLPDGDTARVTVATVGDVRDGAYVVGALADELARESTRVAVVDLTTSGVLSRRSLLRRLRPGPIRNRQLVHVHRHDVRVAELGTRASRRLTAESELGKAEVVLTLIELDLGTGVEALGDLAETSVVLVTAGEATAERLRSSTTLLRQAGLHPEFAMLTQADDTDESSGHLDTGRTPPAAAARRSS
jgi:capsular polysaccharide biosynthesis protein